MSPDREESETERRTVTTNGGGSTAESAIVELRDVSIGYGETPVVDDISLAVDRGSFLGLIGPNGAGKTSLLRAINGVLSPDSGEVIVDGHDITDRSARQIGKLVATVPQTTALSFAFSVREIVAMGRNPYRDRLEFGQDETFVETSMERTGVARFSHRNIDEISGGERQRVILARALAQDTPILLLDEPTASLDINHQVQTLELVADLVEEGKTVIAAIHDLNLAAHYCDELALLANGGLLETGTPQTVLTAQQLKTAFETRAAITTHPVTGSIDVTALPDRKSNLDGHVHVVAGGASASSILYRLDTAGYSVTTGPVPSGDVDAETAQQLGIDVVKTPAYEGVDDEAVTKLHEFVRSAAVTVIPDIDIGPGTLPILRTTKDAKEIVLVHERPLVKRNFAGEEGRVVYEDLRKQAIVVDSASILDVVETVVERRDSTTRGSATSEQSPPPTPMSTNERLDDAC